MIGSLRWDDSERKIWRQSRVELGGVMPVQVPIRYGRRARGRGNTFTMTFAAADGNDGTAMGRFGRGILTPCKGTLGNPHALIAEAQALWKAESLSAEVGPLGTGWGCVGAIFRNQPREGDWPRAWSEYFRVNSELPIYPVDRDGMLGIPWPVTVHSIAPSNFDVILATATLPEQSTPAAENVADAWIDQEKGYERYFFENIRCGIRTPEDSLIWARIEELQPEWLRKPDYAYAMAILRGEHSNQ